MDEGKGWSEGQYPVLGRTTLQLIAAITMLCDHFACIFLQSQETVPFLEDKTRELLYIGLRTVGRLSFPVFCFLLVQGFQTTHNLKNYLLRLFVFAVLSEIPYDLAFSNCLFDWGAQNVILTLLIGLLVLIGIRRYETNIWMEGVIMLAGCGLAWFLRTDYSALGVVLIVLLYLLRDNKISQFFWTACLFFCQGEIAVFGVFALPVCWLYRADKQEKRLPRYFFYLFYPAHLLVLWGISLLL